MSISKDLRFLLVTSVRNEGSSIWEWVAHHLLVGFTDIVVFQNDSNDGTQKSLRALAEIGAIQFFNNGGPYSKKNRNWQSRAYRRISEMPVYQQANFAIALDGDEYLCIKTEEGDLKSLMSKLPDADEYRLNWKIFGSDNQKELCGDLVTERYVMGQTEAAIAKKPEPFKTLFKPQKFLRPGIHRPKFPHEETQVVSNGSGMPDGSFPSHNWYSADPEMRKYAQINHYMLRDAQSFLLKAYKGRPGFPPMDVDYEYWSKHDINTEQDLTLNKRSDALIEKMQELDEATGGALYRLRIKAMEKQLALFEETQKNEGFRKLYEFICAPT